MNLAEERMYRSKLVKIKSSRNAIIASLEKILYEKHSETEEHTQRVKELSVKLGRKLNLSQEQLEELELLSLLHDIGKIGIPDNVLMKPGKLTDEEWDIMKKHTEIGYRIAKATPGLSHVANEILCHHEKFDGTGYPQGLKEGEIPILSRIINIIDSFDVMTHKRIYKNANDMNYAIKELERCSETQLILIWLENL
ncbi:HD-GYP domain-containing protein [Clostridium ljungdahlii]|uniref:HD-GYP domain-containing protein n=1 Tax=Clostridium ljungdahlii TaxID=1538 RepID=UPI0038644D6A